MIGAGVGVGDGHSVRVGDGVRYIVGIGDGVSDTVGDGFDNVIAVGAGVGDGHGRVTAGVSAGSK